jgi:hypothetical protein
MATKVQDLAGNIRTLTKPRLTKPLPQVQDLAGRVHTLEARLTGLMNNFQVLVQEV